MCRKALKRQYNQPTYIYLSIFIPESHIERSSADIADWVLHQWPFKIGQCLICSGVAVTLFKDRKTMLVGCGEINRQLIMYKSVAHLSDVGLASINDFLIRRTLWNWPAICLSTDYVSADFEGHHSMVCLFQSPIADGRRRWLAHNPDNPQIMGYKRPFSPKHPSDRHQSLYVTRVLHKSKYTHVCMC